MELHSLSTVAATIGIFAASKMRFRSSTAIVPVSSKSSTWSMSDRTSASALFSGQRCLCGFHRPDVSPAGPEVPSAEPLRDQRLPVPTDSGSASLCCPNWCFNSPVEVKRCLACWTSSTRFGGNASRARRAFSTCSSCSAGVKSRPISLHA